MLIKKLMLIEYLKIERIFEVKAEKKNQREKWLGTSRIRQIELYHQVW